MTTASSGVYQRDSAESARTDDPPLRRPPRRRTRVPGSRGSPRTSIRSTCAADGPQNTCQRSTTLLELGPIRDDLDSRSRPFTPARSRWTNADDPSTVSHSAAMSMAVASIGRPAFSSIQSSSWTSCVRVEAGGRDQRRVPLDAAPSRPCSHSAMTAIRSSRSDVFSPRGDVDSGAERGPPAVASAHRSATLAGSPCRATCAGSPATTYHRCGICGLARCAAAQSWSASSVSRSARIEHHRDTDVLAEQRLREGERADVACRRKSLDDRVDVAPDTPSCRPC